MLANSLYCAANPFPQVLILDEADLLSYGCEEDVAALAPQVGNTPLILVFDWWWWLLSIGYEEEVAVLAAQVRRFTGLQLGRIFTQV